MIRREVGKNSTHESLTARAEFEQSPERTGWIFGRENSNPQVLCPLRHSPIFLLANKNNTITFGVKLNEHNDIRDYKPLRTGRTFLPRRKARVLFTPPPQVNSPRPWADFRGRGEPHDGGIINDDK